MPYIESEKVDEKTRVKLEALLEKSYLSYWRKKRLFDIFFATLILLFFIPLMVIIAIVICIDDPSAGPFFKQKRVGRHGKEFYMYKFRTMRPNADSIIDELKDKNEMSGPVFKMKDDGLAEVINQPSEQTLSKAVEAKNACPVNVIDIK